MNLTQEFKDWFLSITPKQQDSVLSAIDLLKKEGPELKRPTADRIKGSKYHNMKELRPSGIGKHLRVLFMFDPDREAILLLGGDKTSNWKSWYNKAIPKADNLYEQHLARLTKEATQKNPIRSKGRS